MRIALPYENGQIFQHFGRATSFKIYDVAEGNILAAEVNAVEPGTEHDHELIASNLTGQDVSCVICGGIGAGAQSALEAAGIVVISGASGNTDDAVEMFLAGELRSAGVTCDHHDHEEAAPKADDEAAGGCGGCCGSDSEDCGGGCSGCGGGCGAPQIILEGPNAGKTVKTHYRGTFNDGTEFDSSYGRGEPLEFICGAGMMIRGFDEAVLDMKVGDTKDIHLTPDQAYGESNPNMILTVEQEQMPGSEELEIGMQVALMSPYGQQIPVVVTAKDDKMITFDANHPMAGKELNFHIEMVEIAD